jgi:hypothetical protein
MIEIKEVKTKKDVKMFATYPLKLYKGCPYYVPSLRDDEMNTFNPNKNFSLKHSIIKGFLAFKDGELVGRIAGFISIPSNQARNEKYIRFSRLECINDIEVFKALLGAVEKFGKEQGMEFMHGPWGFNDQDREGMLTEGFDRRSTYATNYYYPYFCENMKKLGFNDESKWVEKEFVIPKEPIKRIVELADKLKEKYNLRELTETLTIKQIIKQYGNKVFETLNDAYGHLDNYVPVDDLTWKNLLSSFAIIVNRKYSSFLVDENDDIVAFGVVFPSICEALKKHQGKLFPTGFISLLKSINKPDELEMALIGVRHNYKNTGINSIVISRIMKNVISSGIKRVESNPMLETNSNILNQWKFIETNVVKKRQTYVKPIV